MREKAKGSVQEERLVNYFIRQTAEGGHYEADGQLYTQRC